MVVFGIVFIVRLRHKREQRRAVSQWMAFSVKKRRDNGLATNTCKVWFELDDDDGDDDVLLKNYAGVVVVL